MFGILFGVIGLVFSLAFGLVSGTTKVAYGTTKVAVGTTTAVTKFTLGLAIRNAVRAAVLGLLGYLLYELVVGYAQGKATANAAQPARLPPPARPAGPSSSVAGSPQAAARPSPIIGAGDHAGRAVQVDDGSGTHHAARVGRGVIRR